MHWTARLFCLVAALESASAAPAKPMLQPAGKWVVDFDDTQCVASRNYGTEDRPLYLGLKAPPAGEVIQLNVAREGGGGRYGVQLDAKIAFDGAPPIRTTMVAFKADDSKLRIFRMNLPLEQFEAARMARSVSITGGSELKESFSLNHMQPVLKLLDSCVESLRAMWNMRSGEGPKRPLAQSARGNLQGLITGEDYPTAAVRGEDSGVVKIAALIDESGRVADCTVIETSGIAALDVQSCALIMERARFQPAIGSDGKPAKDSHVQRISWRLE